MYINNKDELIDFPALVKNCPGYDQRDVRELEDLMGVCFWETNANMKIIDVGHSCTTVFGDPRALVIGEILTDRISGNDQSRSIDGMQDIIASRATFRSYTVEIKSITGAPVVVDFSGRPKFHESSGEFAGYQGFAKSIDSQPVADDKSQNARGSEQFSQLLKSLNQIVSHELRTPLNAVVGFAQCLEAQIHGPIGDERYLEYTNHIVSGANDLDRAVMRLLTYMQSITDRKRLDQVVNLASLMNNVLGETSSPKLTQDMSTQAKGSERAPIIAIEPSILEDAIRELQSISSTLEINGYSYSRTEYGGIRLDLELVDSAKGTNCVSDFSLPGQDNQGMNGAFVTETASFGPYLAAAMLDSISCSLTSEIVDDSAIKFSIWIPLERVIQAGKSIRGLSCADQETQSH